MRVNYKSELNHFLLIQLYLQSRHNVFGKLVEWENGTGYIVVSTQKKTFKKYK